MTASRSLALHFYQLPECTKVRTVAKAHEAPMAVMAIDPTSSLLATGSADGTVKVWDMAGGFCTHVFRGHGGVISALCWHVSSARGTQKRTVQLFTGCVDGKVRVWDLQGGAQATSKPVAVLSGHASVVRGLGVSPDGRTLVSGARDQTLVFWDAREDGRWQRRDIQLVHERVEAVGFVAPTLFYTAGSMGALRLWRADSGTEVSRAVVLRPVGDDDELHGLMDAMLVPSGGQIVTVSATQDLAYFAVGTSPPSLEETRQLVGYNDEIVDLAIVQQHLAVASNNTQLRLYKLDTQDHDVVLVDGHKDMVLSLDACAHEPWLVSGSKDYTARVWAPVGGRRPGWACLAVCEGHAESVGSVVVARQPVGAVRVPFVITASQDRTVKVWDTSRVTLASRDEKLTSLLTLKIHDKDINAIDLAPNQAMLVSGSQDRTAKVFRLEYTPPSKTAPAQAKLEPLATCRGHKRGVWSVQFSPVEQAFATASSDQTVRMWSLKDFSCVRVFEGHTGSVLRVRYLPGGAQLASSANDGLIKVWNVRDESCAVTLDAHDDKIWTMVVRDATATTPLQIVSGAADSTVRVWCDTTAAVEAEAAAAAKEAVEREQAFTNLVMLKDYRNAIALALQLRQPRRLLQLLGQVASSRADHDAVASMDALLADALGTQARGDAAATAGSITGLAAVDQIVASLPPAQLVQLLGYIRDWNTSARTSPVAQVLLHAIVRQVDATALLDAMDAARAAAKDAKDAKDAPPTTDAMLDGLVPYTERHYARVDRMLVESAMLEYSLQAMDAVLGEWDGMDEEPSAPAATPAAAPAPAERDHLSDTSMEPALEMDV